MIYVDVFPLRLVGFACVDTHPFAGAVNLRFTAAESNAGNPVVNTWTGAFGDWQGRPMMNLGKAEGWIAAEIWTPRRRRNWPLLGIFCREAAPIVRDANKKTPAVAAAGPV